MAVAEDAVTVSVSSVSVEHDQVSSYERIVLDGPFFQRSGEEALAIMARTVYGGPDRFTFIRGESPVGVMTAEYVSVMGVCLSPSTSLLSVLALRSHGGSGDGDYGTLFAVSFDAQLGALNMEHLFEPFTETDMRDVLICRDDQEMWSEPDVDGPARKLAPCECRYERRLMYDAVAYKLMDFMAPFWGEYPFIGVDEHEVVHGDSEKLGEKQVPSVGVDWKYIYDEGLVRTYLHQASSLPADSRLTVRWYESPRFEVAVVSYDRDSTGGSYQYLFVKGVMEEYWRWLSIGFFRERLAAWASVNGFLDETTIWLVMCVSGCWSDGWSPVREAVVDLDLETFTAKLSAILPLPRF